jgi:carboxylesterase
MRIYRAVKLLIIFLLLAAFSFLFIDEKTGVEVEAIQLAGTNSKSVFIIDGITGTPNPYKEIAVRLNADGYSVYVPILKNHGGKLSAIKDTDISEIKAQLKSQILNISGDIIIMGECSGALLALDLSNELNKPAVLINIPLSAAVGPFANLPIPYIYRFDYGLLKNSSRLNEVPRFRKYPIHLMQDQLEYRKTLNLSSAQRILIMQSKNDIRAPSSGAIKLHSLANESEIFFLNNSGHLAYMDIEKEIFYERLKEFLEKQ